MRNAYLFFQAKHKEQLRRIEDERERQIADHGAVLASVQKRYAEEAAKVQKQEKSVSCYLVYLGL